MNLLLDTHVLLWWLGDSRKATAKIRKAIDEADIVWVSAVSAWELEVKRLRGLLDAPMNLEATLQRLDIQTLALKLPHAVAAARLPMLHRDPFDRMLVAQASLESLTLCTGDKILAEYGISVLLA